MPEKKKYAPMAAWQKKAFKKFGLKMTRVHQSKRKALHYKQANQRLWKHAMSHCRKIYKRFTKKYHRREVFTSYTMSDFEKGGHMAKEMQMFVRYFPKALRRIREKAKKERAAKIKAILKSVSKKVSKVNKATLKSMKKNIK